MSILLALSVAAAAPLPPEVRSVIEAAVASGDAQAVATVARFARQAHPGAAAEIEEIVQLFTAARTAREAEAARARQDALASAGMFENWTGQVELGASRSTGRTNSLGVLGGVSLERQGVAWRHRLNARAELQETNNVRSTERVALSWEPRRALGERLYAVGTAQYDHDPILGFDNRYTLGLGGGYTLVASEGARLDLEAGPAVRWENPVSGDPARSIAARASADLRWQIRPTLELRQTGTFYLEDGNRTGRALTALDTNLFGDLALRLSYELRYERAGAGTGFLDTTRRATNLHGREGREPISAKARTGKVPMPATLGGAAVNRKPRSGSAARLVRCSQIGIPAPSNMVWTGRDRALVSSILWLSIPTKAAPASFRKRAAWAVRNGWFSR
jgi:putative salt-induced outer membrane protein